MSMKELTYTVKGRAPLLMNNPQTVDRFNEYAKKMKVINNKGAKRTDEDYMELRDLEMQSKIYWDDQLHIYVPSRWMAASLAKVSFKRAKISKADFRGGVFMTGDKYKLHYRGEKTVKGRADVEKNENFRQIMLLPQGQIRVAKAVPIFHEWYFSGEIEYDDKVLDPATLENLIIQASYYGGFGDFRPTFGRAEAVVTHA